jgi:hypothetical protein
LGRFANRPYSSVFARLASGAFYETIVLLTFYEIINNGGFVRSPPVPLGAGLRFSFTIAVYLLVGAVREPPYDLIFALLDLAGEADSRKIATRIELDAWRKKLNILRGGRDFN